MKRIHRIGIAVAFAAAVAALPAASGEDGNGQAGEREIAYSWTIEGHYPQTGNGAVDERIKKWVTDTVEASMEDASTSYGPDFGWEGHKQFYRANVRHVLSRPGPGAVSVVFYYNSLYSLQAHSMTAVEALNLRTDGGSIAFDDLFADPDAALKILAEASEKFIRAKIRKENPEYFGDGGADDGVFFMDGFEPTRDNYETLGLEPDGVRVYFQLYQILPFALGISEVPVSLETLAPVGPNPEIWPGAR